MRLGLGVLRLAPGAFWRMSPRELAAALGRVAPESAIPARSDLDAMMRLFPDRRR